MIFGRSGRTWRTGTRIGTRKGAEGRRIFSLGASELSEGHCCMGSSLMGSYQLSEAASSLNFFSLNFPFL